jgi:hypothetical protein
MKTLMLFVGLFLLVSLPARGEGDGPRTCVAAAVVLNVVPGFGLGSLLQGDTTGFAILRSADLVHTALLVAGYVWAVGIMLDQFEWREEQEVWAGVLVGSWVTVLLASKAYGVVRPFWFASHEPGEPRGNGVSFAVTPIIGCSAGIGMALVVGCATGN